MNHEMAIDTQAAERYLLGELSPADLDAFESHYFDCQLCASDVEDGIALSDGIRAVSRETPFLADRRKRDWSVRWTAPLAAAAAVAVALLGYEQFAVVASLKRDISQMRQARVIPSYQLNDVRAPLNVVVDGRAPFTLTFDVTPEQPSPSYTASIVDAAGKTRYAVPVTAEQAQRNVQLLVPGGVLGPGSYKLRITGAGGASVDTFQFKVR